VNKTFFLHKQLKLNRFISKNYKQYKTQNKNNDTRINIGLILIILLLVAFDLALLIILIVSLGYGGLDGITILLGLGVLAVFALIVLSIFQLR